MELTTKQVADAFRVSPVTVSLWSRNKKLVGHMPRNARKSGRRFRVDAVRAFARNAGDQGYSERKFEEWFKRNREVVLAAQRSSDNSTEGMPAYPLEARTMASTAMARHPRGAGDKTREHITDQLRYMQVVGRPAPTIDELVAQMRMAKGNVRHHIDWLAEAGIVEVREEKREVARRVVVLVEGPRP